MSKLKVVLDTNVILSSIFPTSKYQPILRGLANDTYDAFVTTEIVLEYEEKLTSIFGQKTSHRFMELCQTLPNVVPTEVY